MGRRPRLRGHRPARRAQAAHRGGRGLRGGRRPGDRAGLRPDRRVRGARSSACPRSSARSSPRRRAAAPARSACPTAMAMELALTGDPINAERAHELGLVDRARRAGRRRRRRARARARRSPRTARSRSIATKEILRRPRDWTEEEFWAQAGRDQRPGVRLRGRARGRDGVRREARAGLEGPVTGRRSDRSGPAGRKTRRCGAAPSCLSARRADRGVRRRRVLDGGREPAARRLRALARAAASARGCASCRRASGDADHYVVRFYRAFSPARCEPSHVSLFRRDRGGARRRPSPSTCSSRTSSTSAAAASSSLLGVWRAHGLDDVLRECWQRGIVLCGLSAGSLCWFDQAVTAFHGAPQARRRASACCRTPTACTRRRAAPPRTLPRAVADGMCAGYGAEDGAALHFVGTDLHRVVTSRPQARAYRVERPARRADAARRRLPRSVARGGSRRDATIFAMGGGGFTMEPGNPALDEFILALPGGRCRASASCRPPAATPTSRSRGSTRRFADRAVRDRAPVALPPRARPGADVREHLLAQDIVYVGGGSMRNMLAIWRAHGLDEILRRGVGARRRARRPERRGDVLVRARASRRRRAGPRRSTGLGLLPGSLSVHRDGEPERLPVYLDAVRSGALPGG